MGRRVAATLMQIEESGQGQKHGPSWGAFLELGFRPFYMLGMAWAAAAVGLWVFAPASTHAPLAGMLWHAHEMLWGFVATIAVGFLLTAVPTWTGLPTLRGPFLGIWALVWLLARLLLWLGGPWYGIGAVFDVTFFVGAAVAIARPIARSRDRRNYGVPLLLLGIGAADAAFLWGVMGGADRVWDALNTGLLLMAAVALLIARRVIPFFVNRALPALHVAPSTRSGLVNLGLVLGAIVLREARWHRLSGALLLSASCIVVWQWVRWKPWGVLKKPLLWILYVGYAGLGLGLGACGARDLGAAVPNTLWVHLLALWGFSVLIIGMVTRTALGHLGRALELDGAGLTAYALLLCASAARIGAIFWPVNGWAIALAALMWIAACLVYLVRFVPWLISPRADGRGTVHATPAPRR